MSYRIRYEVRRNHHGRWMAAGVCFGAALWGMIALGPVWQHMAAGEGLYDALARFVGGMILGAS